MKRLYANRSLLGNIGLVLFLALLATLTFGTVPQAEAQVQTNVDPNNPVAVLDKDEMWQTGKATLYTNKDKNQVEITFQVLTNKDFESLFFKILKGNETVLDKVYLKDAVYEKVDEGVYGAVYQVVYDWVYNNLDLENDYKLEVYAGDSKLGSVTLDLEAPPPEGPGGGGGGGGGGGAVSPTTAVSTGTVAVENGIAILTVDAKKVAALVSDPDVKEIVFAIPASIAAEGKVALSAAVLASVLEAGKEAVFETGGVRLVIDPNCLSLADLKALAGEGANLLVSITKASAPVPAGAKLVSDIYELKNEVIGADGLSKGAIAAFQSPITIALPYSAERLQGVNEDWLSIFRYNEKSGAWDLVPGSRVDKASDKVTVPSYSLSKYAVMAYEAAFTDISGHWAEDVIRLMAAKGIVKGMTPTLFVPEAEVTRAQFATLLVKALNISEQAATGSRFSDVPASAWYAATVETAAANGLLRGYPDGSFKPDARITRQELAAMVVNALKLRGKDGDSVTAAEAEEILKAFTDSGQIGAWAKQAAAVAVKSGIVKGRAADQFAPLATAKRCEAVVMLRQILSFLGEL